MVCGSEWTLLGGPNGTCTEPLSLAVEQFLEMVRFEQRARLAELPEELVRGQDVFLQPPISFP